MLNLQLGIEVVNRRSERSLKTRKDNSALDDVLRLAYSDPSARQA